MENTLRYTRPDHNSEPRDTHFKGKRQSTEIAIQF